MNAKYNGWQVELNEAKAELQAREALIAELVEALEWAYETLGEINLGNHSHEDVCELNNKSVEVILGVKPTLTRVKEAMKG